MIKKLTRMGRLSLPAISLMLFFAITSRASQDFAKINLKGNNITLASLFKSVKKQTGLTVFYNNALLDDSQTITVNFRAAELDEVMTVALKGKGLDWVVRNRYILLQKAAPATQPQRDNTLVPTPREEVNGRVTDETDAPLPGVSVKIKGKSVATSTDNDGRYRIIAKRSFAFRCKRELGR